MNYARCFLALFLGWAHGATSPAWASRAWVEPGETEVECLDCIHVVHVVPGRSGLGAKGGLEVHVPWPLVGFDAASPPPPITMDQVDVSVSGEPRDCRMTSELDSGGFTVVVDRFAEAIAGDDTISIGFRFPWIPSRPGRYPVSVDIDRGYGKTRPVPSGSVIVHPSLRLAVPSRVASGESVPIRIHAPGPQGEPLSVEYRLNAGPFVALDGIEGTPVRGYLHAPNQPGFHRVEARLVNFPDVPSVRAVLCVAESDDASGVWWMDLHGHSALSDGFGSPESYHRHARNVTLLDGVALTDHDFMLDDREWSRVGILADSMESFPGFSAIPGYEWSSRFGDRTVLLPHADVGILGRSDPIGDHPYELQAWARSTGAVLLLQHPASAFRAMDWRFHDPETEPICEIYSMHGLAFSDTSTNPFTPRVPVTARAASPRLAMAAPGRSYRAGAANDPALGVMAAGDIHSARPGDLGLAAVLAEAPTRSAILEALRARRVYGTTGVRIVLEFEVNGVGMGGHWTQDGPLDIQVRAAGPSDLDYVLILRDGHPVFRQDIGGSEVLATWSTDIEYARTVAYQAVVVDVNGDRAWSSPVRVDPSAGGSELAETSVDRFSPVALADWTQVLDVADPSSTLVLDLPEPGRVRFSLSGRCEFRGVQGTGPALDDDDLTLWIDGVAGRGDGARIDGLVSLGRLDTLQLERNLSAGIHRVQVDRDGAPTGVHLRAWFAPGAEEIPKNPDIGDASYRPLGPDLPFVGLVGLEDGVVVTRHPVAPGVVLLAVQWTRDLYRTSGFSEERRWVEVEIRLSGGTYVVHPRGFEEHRDELIDNGRGRIRAVARADGESGLEVLAIGSAVDATVDVRSGGHWAWGRVADEEHQLRGVIVPLTGRFRSIRLENLPASSSARGAHMSPTAPIFPDTSVLEWQWSRAAEPTSRIPRLNDLIALRPRDPVPLRHLARAHRDAQDWEEAAGAFGKARRLDGATTAHLIAEAEMLRRSGDGKGSVRRIEEALARNDSDVRALREAVRIWLDLLDDPAGALLHADRLLVEAPDDAWAHLMKARALISSGQIVEGRRSAERAIALDPEGNIGRRARGLPETGVR